MENCKSTWWSTSNTTSKAFAEFIKEDVESLMARGLLTLGAGGLAEFETGFFQEGAELAIKSIYNEVKDKEMFQTPDSLVDGFVDMLYAGAQEAVGGFVMGTIPAAANMAQGNRLPMSDSQWVVQGADEGRQLQEDVPDSTEAKGCCR